jgi:hypothetical protein
MLNGKYKYWYWLWDKPTYAQQAQQPVWLNVTQKSYQVSFWLSRVI